MSSAIYCLLLSSIVSCDKIIKQIPAPNIDGEKFQPWSSHDKQFQPRTDPGNLESIFDIKSLFSPGFGVFKNLLPTQLSIRPERDARY
jgi:hypothetical protein